MRRRGAEEKKNRKAARPKLRIASCPRVSAADLQEQLHRRTRELHEALEQQAATSEVLRVISTSSRRIIRDMLAPTDYEIIEAENGEEALAAIAKQRPDLILMDVQLPIMDGYTATRRIKADPALRSITIIAVTFYALNGEEQIARAAGCDDYVPKPFSPRELLAKIRQHLS